MNPQEKDVINGIFDRLRQVEGHPRDPEAEAYIAERVAAQPYAPYALAQVVHVQEEALTRLKEQLDGLEAELEEARRGATAQTSGGGFLSGLFGGGASEPPQAPRPPASSARPGQAGSPMGRGAGPAWQNAQQPDAMGQGAMSAGPWGARMGGGGGFLSTALTTAAGVAGGMVVGNMLASAFGLGSHGDQTAEAAKPDVASNASDTSPPEDNDARIDQAAYDDGNNDADFGAGDDADFGDGGSDWV
ncbi:DUF2076 domain-containing protein [Chelatococcus sp. GCM10030263]|uniref:DUF2076 domain-containing protein n=1 Tax=Chelatococcus sp. GCM10030263 TaxID=3273387 RepID=UPI00362017E8